MITWYDKHLTKRTNQTGPDISVAVSKKKQQVVGNGNSFQT